MKRTLYKILLGLIVVIAVAVGGGYAYLHSPKFGALPEGERLERILRSPNYRDGEFRTLDPIPARQGSALTGWIKILLTKKERPAPTVPVPYIKTDFFALDKNADLVVWLGHASYYMQLEGKRYLIDPVFSDHAAPVSFVNRAFQGSAIYSAEDFPDIDFLLITHDHWDHLDYPAIMELRDKVGTIIMPLGVGAHFERWGFPASMIHELDWQDELPLTDSITLHALPALHYSGRTTTRNKTLWTAYALVGSERKIYLGGDSGYGSHFKAAGETFGSFDLAILDSGQYNENWRWVHMMPEDTAQAAEDLNAKAIIPIHTGKFAMAYHTWDDPFYRMVKASEGKPYELIMPVPGEVVYIDNLQQNISRWWEQLEKTQ